MTKKYWKEFNELPRFSFLMNTDEAGNPVVERFKNKSGAYINADECGEVIEDMEGQINRLTGELRTFKEKCNEHDKDA